MAEYLQWDVRAVLQSNPIWAESSPEDTEEYEYEL